MFCPNDDCPDFVNTGLRSEFRRDISVCPFCGSAMVDERPSDPIPEIDGLPPKPRIADDEVMEPVIESTDLTEIAVIKSVLDAAGIPYVAHGDDKFSAFRGAFVGGSIFSPHSRGVVVTVPIRMAEQARVLLEEFEEETEAD